LRRTKPGGHLNISDTEGWGHNKNLVWLFEPPQSGKRADPALGQLIYKTEFGNMTLVTGHEERQAWPRNNSEPLNNTGLSLNSQPASVVATERRAAGGRAVLAWGKLPGVDSDLQPNVTGSCLSTVKGKHAPAFYHQMPSSAGHSVLGFKEHTRTSRLCRSEHRLKDT